MDPNIQPVWVLNGNRKPGCCLGGCLLGMGRIFVILVIIAVAIVAIAEIAS